MTDRDQSEYVALRATIRERGTARVCIFALGIAAWAALTLATAALASAPIAVLLPLVVLAGIFEAVFALHVGVERIGRYLHVFHEGQTGQAGQAGQAGGAGGAGGAGAAGWEHLAAAFGKPVGAATSNPLFCVIFFLAALANALPALMLNPLREELIFVAGAHALFVLRLLAARHTARNQRAIDQARFEQLKATLP
jgi:hypothetical protein